MHKRSKLDQILDRRQKSLTLEELDRRLTKLENEKHQQVVEARRHARKMAGMAYFFGGGNVG